MPNQTATDAETFVIYCATVAPPTTIDGVLLFRI